jgi:O-antigen/teichoic acid export membrane protein
MLGFLAPINVVGLYQLTAKIKTVCTTAVNSVANVMLPRLSFYTSHKHPRLFDKLFAKNINFLMISSFTIVGILEISPSDFVLILGGEHFAQSATSLQFLAPAIAFSAFNSFLAQYFIAKNQEKIWSITSVVGLFISIVLMLVITPLFGASGAGIGMSISEFSVLMFRAFQCRHYLASLHEHLNVAKILICGIAAAILSFVASSAFQAGPVIHLVVVSVVMAASYLMGLCISKESFTMTIMSSLKKRIFK